MVLPHHAPAAVGELAGRAIHDFRFAFHPDRMLEIAAQRTLRIVIGFARHELSAMAALRILPVFLFPVEQCLIGGPIGIVPIGIIEAPSDRAATWLLPWPTVLPMSPPATPPITAPPVSFGPESAEQPASSMAATIRK